MLKLIHHHPLKHVALVVGIVRPVPPKDVQVLRRNHEAANAHPQAVRKGRRRERDDEDGGERGDKDDEGLGGEQVEEEPHDPVPEAGGGGLEVGEPVGDDGEDDGDDEEEGHAGDEVGDHEGGGSVEAVGALLDEESAVLEEGGDVGDGHEGHEGSAKKL